jgi:hypothetical protein
MSGATVAPDGCLTENAMPPVLFVYVDNSNLWIEGQYLSARRKGLLTEQGRGRGRRLVDHGWTYDFGRLYQLACPADALIGRCKLWGSRPPQNDSLWERARDQGFEVEVFARNAANKEKGVDVAIATAIADDSHEYMRADREDTVVLVSGDGDFLPTFRSLRRRGLRIRLIFWSHGTSRVLREFADEYVALDPYLDQLTLSRVMSLCPERSLALAGPGGQAMLRRGCPGAPEGAYCRADRGRQDGRSRDRREV